MSIERLLATACAVIVSGCLSSPQAIYPGAERPSAELAILREGPTAPILGIDGVRVFGGAWSVLPGRHEVWMRVRVFTNAPNTTWKLMSFCRVTLEAEAGEEYESRLRKREAIAPSLSKKVQMEVGIIDSSGALLAVAGACQNNSPPLED